MDFVETRNNFSLLRKLPGAIGLSPEAVDDIIGCITGFLTEKGEKPEEERKYPFNLQDQQITK